MTRHRKVKWWKSPTKILAVNTFMCAAALGWSVTTASCFKSPVAPSTQEIKASYTDTTMTVTAYTPLSGVNITTKKVVVGRDAAVSRDRLDLLGKRVYVMCQEGNPVGMRYVTDLMAEGATNKLDILVDTEKTAKKFGTNICTVVVLKD